MSVLMRHINHFNAKNDYNRFQFVLLADYHLITVIGSEMSESECTV